MKEKIVQITPPLINHPTGKAKSLFHIKGIKQNFMPIFHCALLCRYLGEDKNQEKVDFGRLTPPTAGKITWSIFIFMCKSNSKTLRICSFCPFNWVDCWSSFRDSSFIWLATFWFLNWLDLQGEQICVISSGFKLIWSSGIVLMFG